MVSAFVLSRGVQVSVTELIDEGCTGQLMINL